MVYLFSTPLLNAISPPCGQVRSQNVHKASERWSSLLSSEIPVYTKLRHIGLHDKQAAKLAAILEFTNDTPYHGGRLLDGKIYLLTNQDQLYYGTPQHLQKMDVVSTTRTRCFNRQVRTFETGNGLSFRVSNNREKHEAQVKMPLLWGLHLAIPHWQQMHFTNGF